MSTSFQRRSRSLVAVLGVSGLALGSLTALQGREPVLGVTRPYYIAAEETVWDYAPSGMNSDGLDWGGNVMEAMPRSVHHLHAGGSMIVPKRLWLLMPFGMLALTTGLLAAQEARVPAVFDSTGASWVYASYFRIPWARVDSLLKLQRFLPAWRARAIEMGCLVDASILIHHTGNEYNVVRSATYRSFRAIGPVGVTTGGECGDRAWRQVVPDSTLRAALRQGNDWVFLGSPHYDVIYWVPYTGRR